jgi:hypothetical protein
LGVRRTITIRLAARDYVLRAQTSSLAADWKAQLDATVAKLQVPSPSRRTASATNRAVEKAQKGHCTG